MGTTIMRGFAVLGVALAAILATVPAAKADSFAYTISGATLNGWINMDVTSLGSGQYFIRSVAGDLTSPDFSGAFSSPTIPGTPGYYNDGLFQVDNILTPLAPQVLDYLGVYFNDQGLNVNIWNQDDQFYWGDTGSLYGFNAVSVTPTPEPESLVLLGTGLLGFATLIHRRPKQPKTI